MEPLVGRGVLRDALRAGGHLQYAPVEVGVRLLTGFMYSRSFFDLDGHGWQVMWMDPAAAEKGPEAFAVSAQETGTPAA
ncbi:hypothetical protein [Streptomyces echinatus]|uniref:Uncharacterized protein n=1 Tax=Streptomyces echinatus TaxID=67293 RepID=A0A7W9PNH1_9ACTN|nr:hypothetical protein [Streptomyces echinatus]